MADEEELYKPQDAIGSTINSAIISGSAGLLMSSVQNALVKENIGAMGVFTRTGSTIGVLTAMGAAYEFTRCASANIRHKNDHWNEAIGGFFGGSILGLRFRTIPSVLGVGCLASAVLGVATFTGGAIINTVKQRNGDPFERKQKLRSERRRPIQETIDFLGEGRGIVGPGYPERRRQRIKENYDIDVPS